MKIQIARRAVADLESIRSFISADNTIAADAVVSTIYRSVDMLRDFPRMGHATENRRVLELRVPRLPYIVLYSYRPTLEEIIVLRVYHLAQDRRRLTFPLAKPAPVF